ncbi:MAG: 1-acyl-sn-glycerol-3-phosphate acyltransferase [Deltaproteobacteria bacterium]|jgi:1-acyl-sn-glycerol-3-phosphate acyltransferase|nr:1-acyl-sn-glycerol-3-phosphate acyltransferase [Deltaproteobacteria bacterium]
MKKLLDWILFIPFALTFILSLLVGEILQRLALPFGRSFHARSIQIITLLLMFSLKIFGIRIKINLPIDFKLDPDKTYIVISNHQSTIDIVLLYYVFFSRVPRFVAKQELGKWIPTVSFNLRNGHNALIDRNNPRQSIKIIAEFAKIINDNKYLAVIFPEGTRCRRGELKEFMPAGVSALLRYSHMAEIIPVAISNSWKLNPHDGVPAESFANVSITVGDIIERTQNVLPQEIIDQCYNFVKAELCKFS